ncbi:MAG: hypothetical protein GKR94_22475 [Gammaproteobacteria bacterium]|nr:hypothetical protein [Gammaproteobacteria bacterium]
MTTQDGTQAAAQATVRAYIDGFNRRDAAAMASAFNFPHVRFAKGRVVTIPDSDAFVAAQARVTRMLLEEGWHHTVIEQMNVVQSGAEKVHVALEFTRRDKGGAVIHRFDTLWIATLLDGKWGIQLRSSFLLSDAATFGDTALDDRAGLNA